MAYRFLLLISLFFISHTVSSQIDTQFWFVAPDISQTHGDSPILIRLSSMSDPVNYELTMPADPSFTPITGSIGPNSTSSISLAAFKSQIENSPPNQVNIKGLLLTTDHLVTAYYEEANASNPGIFSFKGQNALGLEFYIVSQDSYQNHAYPDDFESFDIVATENNTLVTIIPTDDVVGYAANSTISVTLNKGETYSVRSIHQEPSNTLAGSHITSNKPIAVTWTDDSIETGGWDVICDQLVPVSIIGTEYIAIKGFASNTTTDNEERLSIVGTANGTNLSIDGAFLQTINKGELLTYLIPPSSPTVYVQASMPVYLLHLSGFSGEAGASMLPQIVCTGSRQIGFFRTSNNEFALMILTLDGNQGAFTMDGSSTVIQASDFATVPGTGGTWLYARKTMPVGLLGTGSHLLANSMGKFHLGIINKLGSSSEYGYFSYFSSINLGVDQTICPGSSTTLNGGDGWASYLWEKEVGGVWTTVGGSLQTLTVTEPGLYRCSVTGQNCSLQDEIEIFMHPVDEPVITGDQSVCINETGVNYVASANFAQYDWSVTGGTFSGQGTPSIQVTWNTAGAQQITLDCINQYSCLVQKSFAVVVNPLPGAVITPGGATSFCQGGSVDLNAAGGTGYLWSNAATTATVSVISAGTYTVTVTDANGCINTASQAVVVNPLPTASITASGPTTFCTGGSVDLTAGGGTTYLWSNAATTATITNINSSGNYTVTVTGLNGCTNTASQPVSVATLPLITITPNGSPVICTGESVILTASAGTNYLWSNSATTQAINVSVGGTYTVTVTVGSLGCANEASQVVTVNPLPNAVITPNGPTTFCQNGSVTLSANTGPGYQWLWSNAQTTSAIAVAIGGNYAVTVTNGYNCSKAANQVVTVNPLPVTSFTGQATVCQQYPTKYLYQPGTGPPCAYNWRITPSGAGTIDNATASTASITWIIAGSSTLRLEGQTPVGCTSFSTMTIQVNQKPYVAFLSCNDPVTTTASRPFTLNGGIPLNGQYYIDGNVAAGGIFNPSLLSMATHQVTYTYQDINTCVSTSTPVNILVTGSNSTAPCPAIFTDPRDMKNYPAANLGGHCWMLANLNYGGQNIPSIQPQTNNCIVEKYCPTADVSCSNYGGFYQWDELMQYQVPSAGQYIQGLCPPEWHVPTMAEWQSLIDANQGNAVAGGFFKDPLPPFGFHAVLDGVNYLNKTWAFTSADGVPATMYWSAVLASGKPVARGLNEQTSSVSYYESSKANAFPVRCVRDF